MNQPTHTQRRRIYARDLRPCEVVVLEAETRGTVARGVEIELVRYQDSTLYDRMHARAQLSDRQYEAAVMLGGIWVAAGLEPVVCNGYATRIPDAGEGDAEDAEGGSAADTYRRLLGALSASMAMRLDALMLGEHPGTHGLATLQQALDRLADDWRMER